MEVWTYLAWGAWLFEDKVDLAQIKVGSCLRMFTTTLHRRIIERQFT
jgi:hypothetical protein